MKRARISLQLVLLLSIAVHAIILLFLSKKLEPLPAKVSTIPRISILESPASSISGPARTLAKSLAMDDPAYIILPIPWLASQQALSTSISLPYDLPKTNRAIVFLDRKSGELSDTNGLLAGKMYFLTRSLKPSPPVSPEPEVDIQITSHLDTRIEVSPKLQARDFIIPAAIINRKAEIPIPDSVFRVGLDYLGNVRFIVRLENDFSSQADRNADQWHESALELLSSSKGAPDRSLAFHEITWGTVRIIWGRQS